MSTITANIESLKRVATELKIKFHPEVTAKDLQHMISQQPKSLVASAMEKMGEEDLPLTFANTKEEVLEEIREFVKKDGFVATFPKDGTWIFSCNGAEDSGSLAMPMRLIKRKAQMVSVGRRAPRGARPGEFDKGVGKGYADSVLMA